jgi:hypothetical protein
MMLIGIVGHRYISDINAIAFVTEQCTSILDQAQNTYSDLVALSAIAEGADSIFAEAALTLGIPLEIVRPFQTYTSDFATMPARHRYNRLRKAARNETTLDFAGRSDEAYEAAMRWIVTRSDLLMVAWDGRSTNGPGGTGHAVSQAIQINRSWIHLNVADLSVTHYITTQSIRKTDEVMHANTT